MYNYAPQYSNVPYIQNSAQADANVQFVFQQIGVVLRQLVQSGYIPQQIANQADMLLRQPSNQEAIRNDVIRTYGGMAVSQQDLIDYTTRRVQNMCASINQQNMRSQYYGSGGYYGGYGGTEWIWILIVIFIIFFLFWGSNNNYGPGHGGKNC